MKWYWFLIIGAVLTAIVIIGLSLKNRKSNALGSSSDPIPPGVSLHDFKNLVEPSDVQDMVRRIKGTPKWFDDQKKAAKKNGISIDQQVRDSAVFVLWKKHRGESIG